MQKIKASTIENDEIAQFSSLAGEWWNPSGSLRPLHRLNPSRIAYVRDQIIGRGLGQNSVKQPLKNISLLDVGCGGGLLAEPLARLGACVTGLDASSAAITEAQRHAKQTGVAVDYRVGSVEELARGVARYDVITALEIVEHVAELDIFLAGLAKLLKPKGLLILSTLNRTPKSFLLGIVAAEYVLRWVPRGTHRWSKFVRPSELVRKLEKEKLETTDLTGVIYNPLKDDFILSKDNLGVNYLLTAVKRAAPQFHGRG
jgi:2-polyprenyl-6-hydroxyphenyl methylase/3-demethylubiquinone-9 3-methyltransferase